MKSKSLAAAAPTQHKAMSSTTSSIGGEVVARSDIDDHWQASEGKPREKRLRRSCDVDGGKCKALGPRMRRRRQFDNSPSPALLALLMRPPSHLPLAFIARLHVGMGPPSSSEDPMQLDVCQLSVYLAMQLSHARHRPRAIGRLVLPPPPQGPGHLCTWCSLDRYRERSSFL